MKDYEELYESFWKDIIENEDGTINLDQVKRELFSYKELMNNTLTVNYESDTGVTQKESTYQDLSEMLMGDYLKEKELKDYFDIK